MLDTNQVGWLAGHPASTLLDLPYIITKQQATEKAIFTLVDLLRSMESTRVRTNPAEQGIRHLWICGRESSLAYFDTYMSGVHIDNNYLKPHHSVLYCTAIRVCCYGAIPNVHLVLRCYVIYQILQFCMWDD